MVSCGAWISTINRAVVWVDLYKARLYLYQCTLADLQQGPVFSAGIINPEAKIALELGRESCVTVALNLWRRLSREVCWL